MKGQTSISIPGLVGVYVALLGLLALTVTAALFPLGAMGLLIALAIAAIKTFLVALFFMHIKFQSRNVGIFAMTGLVWLAILFGLTFSDYLSRSWLSRADDLSPHVSALSPQPKDVVRDPPRATTQP
jgi:cytochrome c oxidase subunit IV